MVSNNFRGDNRRLRIGGKIASAALLLLVMSGQPADSSIQAFHRAYGPKSSLLVSSPVLQWEVWPSEGARLTSTSMIINGQPVDATYNSAARRLEYRPQSPLPSGKYDVQCRVLVENRLEVKKNWTFAVSERAMSKLPSPMACQDEGLAETNMMRRAMGLEDAYQEDRLNAASMAHTKYLSQNRRTGHYEKEGEPGFVGVTPTDRLEAFGYSGTSWECVTYNSGGLKESVRDLFYAPYHRIPFLQPGRVPIGTGNIGKHFSMKFGDSGQAGLTVSPADKQVNIPLCWDGNERPNPLRIHGTPEGRVGYPIVLSLFSENRPVLRLKEAKLMSDGEIIPTYQNSSLNDDYLDNSIILIPRRPLRPNTTYSVSVRAEVNDKSEVTKHWSFTTASK